MKNASKLNKRLSKNKSFILKFDFKKTKFLFDIKLYKYMMHDILKFCIIFFINY